jgi:hypothetical protein
MYSVSTGSWASFWCSKWRFAKANLNIDQPLLEETLDKSTLVLAANAVEVVQGLPRL